MNPASLLQVDRRGRVLLVEDDGATRNLISRHLGREGYVITAVESAEAGLVEVGQCDFHAVISDVHLPAMSGIELAGYLLSQDPDLPIVLVTGDPDQALAREALSRGPVSYLLKPFELFELDAAVQQAIGRRQAMALGAADTAVGDRSDARVPEEWLELVDARSYAGPGHAERMTRVALALLGTTPSLGGATSAQELRLVARTHELGRLAGQTADLAIIAVKGAAMLAGAGFPDGVVRAVRHLYERWDGTGGPDRLSGSNIPAAAQLLSVADALDHYCAAWLNAGLNTTSAIDRAINLVSIQQGLMFSPVVITGLQHERLTIRSICAAGRAVQDSGRATASVTA